MTPLTIDRAADPSVPAGWTLVEHAKGPPLTWNPHNVALWKAAGQLGAKKMTGHALRKKVQAQPALNANALDALLAHPEHIPEWWKGSAVFFWGTIYADAAGKPCVRYLAWNGDGWGWHPQWDGDAWNWRALWLDKKWRDMSPAAILITP